MPTREQPIPRLDDPPARKVLPNGDALDEILAGWIHRLERHGRQEEPLPDLPMVPEVPGVIDAAERVTLLGAARQFHLGDLELGGELHVPGDDVVPALLHPFRKPGRIRHDLPLLLFPSGDDRLWAPVAGVLTSAVDADESIDGGDELGRAVRDNIPRLELHLHAALQGAEAPVLAREALEIAATTMKTSRYVSEQQAELIDTRLREVISSIPDGATLLTLGERTALHLLVHIARHRNLERHEALRTQVRELRNHLQEQMGSDLAKMPEGRASASLAETVGLAGAAHLDAEVLANILGRPRGSVPMNETRRARVAEAIESLGHFIDEAPPTLIVVHPLSTPAAECASGTEWQAAPDGRVCHHAETTFDAMAARYARLFGAVRTARLELESAYEPSRHDPLLRSFDWRSFSREETLAMPAILAVESAEHVGGQTLPDLSRLLVSGRPIEVLVPVSPASNPGQDKKADPLLGYHLELAYLGIGHREAFVTQSSAARPAHLVAAFQRSLETTHASLHVVATGLAADGTEPPLGAWLHAGAAIESRAHPLLRYDPDAGETWARRLDFSGNPQCEVDWPVYELPIRQPSGDEDTISIAFTFADFALLERGYRNHFRVIPPRLIDDDLVPLHAYLEEPADVTLHRLPFIWGLDDRCAMHRLVVSRDLAAACRDRLTYWRTLQELAGIRNAYVREAVEHERERLEAAFAAEREQLQETHTAALDTTRAEAAGEAMRRLAAALVRSDAPPMMTDPPAPSAETPMTTTTSPSPLPPPPESPPPSASAPATIPEAPPPPPDAEPEEPWIESVLCTSCNDCLDVNPRLFVYNANKQAVIGDPHAGTYAQLVVAAEKCPARCIHPGTPLDPTEPELDDLVRRAASFNA